MEKQISVAVIDDHPLFRAGVVKTLALDNMIKVVGEGGSSADALSISELHKPDIVLLDITMPGGGLEAAAEIVKLPDPPKVMMLTVAEDDDLVIRALDVGAVGYVLKGIPAAGLITAVRSVAAGESFVSPSLGLRLLCKLKEEPSKSRLSALNQIEVQTLRLVGQGLSNREIGDQLGILEKSVKYHVSRLMNKLQVRNRVEAALVAQREFRSSPEFRSGN